jgi:hypothetical protein
MDARATDLKAFFSDLHEKALLVFHRRSGRKRLVGIARNARLLPRETMELAPRAGRAHNAKLFEDQAMKLWKRSSFRLSTVIGYPTPTTQESQVHTMSPARWPRHRLSCMRHSNP